MSLLVDFATFCHKGDQHRLYAPGQLARQVESNNYHFQEIIVVHQCCKSLGYGYLDDKPIILTIKDEAEIDMMLQMFDIDLARSQYQSPTDKVHTWRYHVVNHLKAISYSKYSKVDYIVFADSDCWMVRQPAGMSWIDEGIKLLKARSELFIISPNDGEPRRTTQRMSQQMFLVRVEDFRHADFNQPGWNGNVNIPGGPIPEYWAMLEGRMELYCRSVGRFRYVLGPAYRYWHHNRLTPDGLFETDMSKY